MDTTPQRPHSETRIDPRRLFTSRQDSLESVRFQSSTSQQTPHMMQTPTLQQTQPSVTETLTPEQTASSMVVQSHAPQQRQISSSMMGQSNTSQQRSLSRMDQIRKSHQTPAVITGLMRTAQQTRSPMVGQACTSQETSSSMMVQMRTAEQTPSAMISQSILPQQRPSLVMGQSRTPQQRQTSSSISGQIRTLQQTTSSGTSIMSIMGQARPTQQTPSLVMGQSRPIQQGQPSTMGQNRLAQQTQSSMTGQSRTLQQMPRAMIGQTRNQQQPSMMMGQARPTQQRPSSMMGPNHTRQQTSVIAPSRPTQQEHSSMICQIRPQQTPSLVIGSSRPTQQEHPSMGHTHKLRQTPSSTMLQSGAPLQRQSSMISQTRTLHQTQSTTMIQSRTHQQQQRPPSRMGQLRTSQQTPSAMMGQTRTPQQAQSSIMVQSDTPQQTQSVRVVQYRSSQQTQSAMMGQTRNAQQAPSLVMGQSRPTQQGQLSMMSQTRTLQQTQSSMMVQSHTSQQRPQSIMGQQQIPSSMMGQARRPPQSSMMVQSRAPQTRMVARPPRPLIDYRSIPIVTQCISTRWDTDNLVPYYKYTTPNTMNPSTTTSPANPPRPVPSAKPCNSDLPQATNRTVLEVIRHRMNASNSNTQIGTATDGTGPTPNMEEEDGWTSGHSFTNDMHPVKLPKETRNAMMRAPLPPNLGRPVISQQTPEPRRIAPQPVREINPINVVNEQIQKKETEYKVPCPINILCDKGIHVGECDEAIKDKVLASLDRMATCTSDYTELDFRVPSDQCDNGAMGAFLYNYEGPSFSSSLNDSFEFALPCSSSPSQMALDCLIENGLLQPEWNLSENPPIIPISLDTVPIMFENSIDSLPVDYICNTEEEPTTNADNTTESPSDRPEHDETWPFNLSSTTESVLRDLFTFEALTEDGIVPSNIFTGDASIATANTPPVEEPTESFCVNGMIAEPAGSPEFNDLLSFVTPFNTETVQFSDEEMFQLDYVMDFDETLLSEVMLDLDDLSDTVLDLDVMSTPEFLEVYNDLMDGLPPTMREPLQPSTSGEPPLSSDKYCLHPVPADLDNMNGMNGHANGELNGCGDIITQNQQKGCWTIGLINSKFRYLTAETFGFKINANGASLKKKQIWTLEPESPTAGDSLIYLRSHLDKYLAVDSFGNVTCESDEKDAGCQFQISVSEDGSGRWALKNVVRGYFLGSTQDKLTCTAKVPGDAEFWHIHLAARPQVNLRSVGRKRFAHLSENLDEIHVDANIPWGEDTLFTLEFRLEESGKYAIHTCNNKYLSMSGKLVDVCNKDCFFSAEYHSGQLALRDRTGQYLSPIGSKAVLKTRSNTVTKDELFSLEDSLPQASFIASLNSRFVSVKQGVDVTANQDEISDHETFQLEFDWSTKRWYIRTMQDRYWTLETGGGIQASGDKRSSNALFDLVWQNDGSLAFRANNGRYVITKRSGHLYATSDAIDDTCKFYFYLINRPILVLKCEQGFVGYKAASNPKLECNKATYECIQVERGEKGIVFFKGQNGKYWHVDSEGVTADSDTQEGFYLELREPTRLCIKSINGNYLTASKNGLFRLGDTSIENATQWEY